MKKVQVKGLAAVDERSGLADVGEVLSIPPTAGSGGKPTVYNCTLTLTDLAKVRATGERN